MAVHDYSRNVATAQRLIAKFGRTIKLERLANSDFPTPATVDTIGVFVKPTGESALGFKIERPQLFSESEQIAIVAWDGLNDLETFDFILDELEATAWRMNAIDKLQPGDTPILYYIGLVK